MPNYNTAFATPSEDERRQYELDKTWLPKLLAVEHDYSNNDAIVTKRDAQYWELRRTKESRVADFELRYVNLTGFPSCSQANDGAFRSTGRISDDSKAVFPGSSNNKPSQQVGAPRSMDQSRLTALERRFGQLEARVTQLDNVVKELISHLTDIANRAGNKEDE